jgi:hypothetical protein
VVEIELMLCASCFDELEDKSFKVVIAYGSMFCRIAVWSVNLRTAAPQTNYTIGFTQLATWRSADDVVVRARSEGNFTL